MNQQQTVQESDKKNVRSIIKKVVISVVIAIVCVIALFAAYVGHIIRNDSRKTKEPTSQQSVSDTATEAADSDENEYAGTPLYREQDRYATEPSGISVRLSEEGRKTFLPVLHDGGSVFRNASFYALDDALQLYKSTAVNKSTQSVLLTDGKLDAQKLYQEVLLNNEAMMQAGKNAVTAFYQDLESDEIALICNEIAKVVNDCCTDENIAKTADTLERLTVFKRTGSASNAYISTNITFICNPTMMGMYENMQKMLDTNPDTVWQQVIDHEIMHLIQHAANDGDDSNGIEIGICRMFNIPNEEKSIPVDSMNNTWILEAGAELAMARYLNIAPGTYAKKISYAVSHNLSRFYEIDSDEQLIENMAFLSSPEEVFSLLRLKDEADRLEFFRFMYSVEITQSEPQAFWDYREEQTGVALTEDEQTGVRMDIRTDAVQYMTKSFFTNLTNAVHDGAIGDLDTVFYMLRLWEIDTFKHLNYTQLATLSHAQDFILWYDRMQTAFLTTLAQENSLDPQQMLTMYGRYGLHLQTDDGTKENCNLSGLGSFMQNYIAAEKENYVFVKYSLIHDVAVFLQEQ